MAPSHMQTQKLFRQLTKQAGGGSNGLLEAGCALERMQRNQQTERTSRSSLMRAYGQDDGSVDSAVTQYMSTNNVSLLDAQIAIDKQLTSETHALRSAIANRQVNPIQLCTTLQAFLSRNDAMTLADVVTSAPAGQRLDRTALCLSNMRITTSQRSKALAVIAALGTDTTPANLQGRRLMSVGAGVNDSIPVRHDAVAPFADLPTSRAGDHDNGGDPGAAARRAALQREHDLAWTGTATEFANLIASKFALPNHVCAALAYRILFTMPNVSPYQRAKMGLGEQGIQGSQALAVLAFIEGLVANGTNVTGA